MSLDRTGSDPIHAVYRSDSEGRLSSHHTTKQAKQQRQKQTMSMTLDTLRKGNRQRGGKVGGEVRNRLAEGPPGAKGEGGGVSHLQGDDDVGCHLQRHGGRGG